MILVQLATNNAVLIYPLLHNYVSYSCVCFGTCEMYRALVCWTPAVGQTVANDIVHHSTVYCCLIGSLRYCGIPLSFFVSIGLHVTQSFCPKVYPCRCQDQLPSKTFSHWFHIKDGVNLKLPYLRWQIIHFDKQIKKKKEFNDKTLHLQHQQ